ncbi:MAG: type VI secretion system tube protein Hcp [Gammaproteobacteria bacterium]|nr:type VI secretion system tube protein Hcp [Gammaproteobacteria bacterium]
MSIYLKTSQAKGDVTVPEFKSTIHVQDIEFGGIKRNITMRSGKALDRMAGFPIVGKVTFLKEQDSSTITFFQSAHNGMVFDSLEFNYVNEGSQAAAYGKTILHQAMVTDFSEVHTGNNHRPLERITVAYNKIERVTIPMDATGKAGNQSSTGYDVEKAQKM